MGFENEEIIHKLVANIIFISIFIYLDWILIVISQISISFYEKHYDASPKYLSTLITKY